MKMSYLSDGKKSILGKRLSSRYLSSDAFTSSAGKMSGRSISQLGSLFGRTGSSRRFSGTGQRIGLFEFKNIFLIFVFLLTCIIVIGYVVPFTRYAMHRFFVAHTAPFGRLLGMDVISRTIETGEVLGDGEYYVSPAFAKTDRFRIAIEEGDTREDMQGQAVYSDMSKDILLGTLGFSTSSPSYVTLISEVGQKNNLFTKQASAVVVRATTSTSTDIDEEQGTSSVVHTEDETEFVSAVFEGFGYGQLRAQIPPQQDIEIGTVLYARTEHGLVQAARVSFVEKDTGSTFTNIYAQLLVPPFNIYKVYIEDTI